MDQLLPSRFIDSCEDASFPTINFGSHSCASSALASPFWRNIQIVTEKWMIANAISFLRIYCRSAKAILKSVLAKRYEAKMFRIYTSTIAAHMVNNHSIGYLSPKHFIRNAMPVSISSSLVGAASNNHSRVTLWFTEFFSPVPASCDRVNYRTFSDSLFQRLRFRSLHIINIAHTYMIVKVFNCNTKGVV